MIGSKFGPKATQTVAVTDRRPNSHQTTADLSPGPATYNNVLAINSTGRYPTTYVPTTLTRRLKESADPTPRPGGPGPGSYQSPSDFGIYISSRFLKGVQRGVK